MISYIALFYCSFCYHAIKTPEIFGKLIIAALLLQALGTLAYLVAPAVGPFIYEAGLNPMITGGQSSMLNFHAQSLAGGPQWLAENGSANFTVGLAAMPSLHSASAFLFFLFAWHHGKILLPLYGFILLYILVMAVASRWHYLIDVPVGMLIAWVSYKLAERFDSRPSASPALTNGVQTAQPVAA
jgi:membrane-associated phospholipid phosphatase